MTHAEEHPHHSYMRMYITIVEAAWQPHKVCMKIDDMTLPAARTC